VARDKSGDITAAATRGAATRYEGGKELKRALKSTGLALEDLRRPGATAAGLVREEAASRAQVERRSGRFIDSVKAKGTQYGGQIEAGGKAAPHFVVREFGGTIPRRGGGRTKAKPRSPKLGRGNAGYFLWPAFRALKPRILELYEKEVLTILNKHTEG
jgi:hypothetical protein